MNHDVKYNRILTNYCKLLGYNGISNHEGREGGPGLWTWICWGYLLQAMGQLDMIWVSLKWWMGSAFTGPKRSKNLPLAATGKTVKLKTQGHMMVSTPLKSMTSAVGIILPNIWKVINFMFRPPPTRLPSILDTIYIMDFWMVYSGKTVLMVYWIAVTCWFSMVIPLVESVEDPLGPCAVPAFRTILYVCSIKW